MASAIELLGGLDQFVCKELRGDVQEPLSSLPDDLLGRVFALLPLQAKLACRCVCRSWNSVLSTDILLTYTSNANAVSSSYGAWGAYFMLTTRGSFAYALDPIADLWHKLGKPACPGACILAASHSLVCVGNQFSECRSLTIFNLLSGARRLLPNMLCVGLLHKVAIAADPLSCAYVVVVTGEDASNFRGRHTYRLHTEVFDSVTGQWRMAGDVMPEAKFGSGPGVWHNGIFYCITEMPYGITAFSLAKGEWMELSMAMPIGLLHPAMVSCGGQLMMVGIQEDDSEYSVCNSDSKSDSSSDPPSQPQSPGNHLANMLCQVSRSSSWPRTPEMLRSPAWSSPLHTWAAAQLRAMLCSLPSVALPFSRSSPMVPPCSSEIPLPPPAVLSLTDSASQPRKCVRIWSWKYGKQWKLLDEMPEEFFSEFMAHLTLRTPLVCAGVGNQVCISSYQSPSPAIFDISKSEWRFSASDPLYPKNRDIHLLGFAVHPDDAYLL